MAMVRGPLSLGLSSPMGFKCQKPSQQDEPPVCSPTPPIPGLSQASDSQLPSHENNSTLGPEPEVAPINQQSIPFPSPPVPCSEIPPVPSPERPLVTSSSPVHSSPHSHQEALQEFTNFQLTLMIPQTIFHKSINESYWCIANFST
ncbi:hypothetical protein O181_029780 [Austropuccinia psidii MF-1]|uniref:Uncharacterized protein n=1 Tax=Austropuccinia psidii MF-1 TaxID=1389203 RepID=A0A9Q3CV13_9BASI|nr:hypothetical protein [Austropuccinia psidii MF-1]